MNNDTAEGKFDQLKGKIKQTVGEALGNDKLANSGAVDEVKGHAKEAWGNTKDAASAVTADAHARAEIKKEEAHERGEDKAHDIRESITSTARNVKDAISAKAEEIKENHKRTA